MHVAVLKGGWSEEREVSLSSGAAVEAALVALGHRVSVVDVAHDIASVLASLKPDVAFNALHGQFGEDGCVQGVLEILGIPYTHSGVMASAIAMDKPMAKKLFASVGLNCAHSMVVPKASLMGRDPMPRPYVVKPSNEGSSVGVQLMMAGDNFFFDEASWPYGDTVMVETYIPGRELTVAVLDDVALGVTELRPISGFYDYENKYTGGRTEHLCPAPLPKNMYDEAMRIGLEAHRVLGCRGLSRSDIRYDESGDGKLYILETNTQPGMTPLSLSPELAQHAGIDFNTLVARLLAGARLGG
jgi:D-alanine-D-alanine ligase